LRLDENNYFDIVKDYDLIVDCFDSFQSKFLLNKIAIETGKTLIHGGVTEFYGQVMTIIPQKTACLNCILPDEKIFDTEKGVISPIVTIIASIETMEVVKIILGIGTTLENKILSYDGLNMKIKIINVSKNSYCKVCLNKKH
jgi:molybdopterin/thiamine biosynthesis adenylyltransferase